MSVTRNAQSLGIGTGTPAEADNCTQVHLPLTGTKPTETSLPVAKPFNLLEDVWVQYGLAAIAAALAIMIRWVLDPVFGDRVVYTFLYVALAFSSVFLGVWPSVFCAVGGFIASVILFVSPRGSFRIDSVFGVAEAITFAGVAILIIGGGEMNRRSRAKLNTAHAQLARREQSLRVLNDELETRVEERTSSLRSAEEAARQLGAQILKTQDEERRRIARELHDGVGQLVALIKMNLSRLERQCTLAKPEAALVADSKALAEGVGHDIRIISHLLHPPLLDEMGLASALEWYVEGFSKRSGIDTNLEITPELGRLGVDCETTIFRIVQEALTNVHRHSGSPDAVVRLICRQGGDVHLEISDHGKGISLEKQAALKASGGIGVGLRGMRERVTQLGGTMKIQSGDSGTTISATFPLTEWIQ